MGATARQEMLPSILAKHLAPCLATVQTEPISVGAGEILTFEGRGLPNLPPTGLRDVLTKPAGPLGQLQTLRDKHLDRIYGLLKESGTPAQVSTSTPGRSRRRGPSLADELLGHLAAITTAAREVRSRRRRRCSR